jgi:hypothetical protein
VLYNDIYATSVELNPSSSATCVIAGSVTTTTSKHISFCMRDDQFCSEFVNSFMECNNHFTLCTYSVQFIVRTMLFTSIPLCIISPAVCVCDNSFSEKITSLSQEQEWQQRQKIKERKQNFVFYVILCWLFQISLYHTSILRQSVPCA